MVNVRRVLGALVAVVVGVALLALALLLLASGQPRIPDRLADAAIVVSGLESRSPEPFTPPVPWSAHRADELARRLAAVPGVATAVSDRTFYMQALIDGRPRGAEGQRQEAYEGHGWSSARLGGLRLVAGDPPQRPGEVVVDRALGVRPGAAVTLLTAVGPEQYRVTGLVDEPGYLVADEVAARLSPGVRAIGLVLEPGATVDRVAMAARAVVGGDGRVLVGDARGELEPRADARARWIGMQVLTGISALAGFVTVFVVASTFAFTVAQRRRELGLLRAIGATPKQVRRMVYGEALLVGALGAVVGVAIGAVTAPGVAGLLVDAGLEPATYAVRYTPLPIGAAILAGPVVALLGAWAAARRAARVRPLAALREAAVEQRPMGRMRWIMGALVTTVGIALAVGTATTGDAQDRASFALYSAMALVTGVAVLAPAVVPPLVRLCRSPLRRGGGAIGLLVREGALTATRRTAATAAPVLLTVAFAVLVAGMVRTSTAAYAAGRAADVDAGWVLVPDNAPGLSDAVVEAVMQRAAAGRPGSPGTNGQGSTGSGRQGSPGSGATGSVGPSPSGSGAAGRGATDSGAAGAGPSGSGGAGPGPGSSGPGVAGSGSSNVGAPGSGSAGSGSSGSADADAVQVGAALLPTMVYMSEPDGIRALNGVGVEPLAFARANRAVRIVAGSLDGLGGRDAVVVPASAGRAVGAAYSVVFADGERVELRVVAVVADGSIPGDLLLSRATVRGHDPTALTSAVYLRGGGAGGIALPPGSGARVIGVATWAAEADSAEDRLVWLFTLMLIGVSAGYGAIAVANTLLMAAEGRVPDLRVVRLAGATRRQVVGYVVAESVLVVLIGALLGGVVAFGALLSIRAGLSEQVGAPVELVVPWSVVGGVVGLCLLLALLATVLPTRRALRVAAVRVPS